MSVVRAPEAWADDQVFTVEDLEDMPDDEFRYELDDGVLIVSPAPPNLHQLAVTRLSVLLSTACPAEFMVLTGPGVNITRFQHRVPDVAVIRAEVTGADSLDIVRPFLVTIVPADLVATGSE
jgi:Uma2 family endonuclease